MRLRIGRLLTVFMFVLSARAAFAQAVGVPPDPSFGFHDVSSAFALPPLKDAPSNPVERAAVRLQVIQRAHRLGLTLRSATEAWRGAGRQFADARERAAAARDPAPGAVFRGDKVSDLNKAIRSAAGGQLLVASSSMLLDEPVVIHRNGLRLDLGRARFQDEGRSGGAYMVRIEGAANVAVVGGVFAGPRSGVLVSASREVVLLDGLYDALKGNGVVVTNSSRVVVWANRMTGVRRAPLILHGATTDSVAAENQIVDNLGSSNWNAGIVVSDRNVDLASDPLNIFRPDHYGVVVQPITDRLTIPRRNLIVANLVARNHASGLYLDGAAEDVVAGNVIQGNAKEGLCLDNGSTADVVALNTVEGNGKRWGASDDDLRRDFVIGFGRMPDGSAKAKVPGVSLDNAAYNIVYANDVDANYGGGVKMVRTGYFNVVGLNTIVDDNEGRSDKFHFFGVELGAAGADTPVPDLNFTPSHGNIVFSNLIRGHHYAGVFFAEGSDANDLFDNAIFGAENWAIESVSRQDNSTLNNLTNLPSRNIEPGLDPRLPGLTAGRFD